MLPSRIISWFSCGAASAVAAKLAVEKYVRQASEPSPLEVIYCDTSRNEHPDNTRFKAAIEKWINWPIQTIHSDVYETVEDVVEGTRYIAGPYGARCTTELKKIPRFKYQRPDDIHIFGYTVDELRRVRDFTKRNLEMSLEWILVDQGITKDRCYEIIEQARIELPVMYKLGFKNNNCIGCLKVTSPTYWLRVKRNFPEIFQIRVGQSRELNVRMLERRVNGKKLRFFLDELTVDMVKGDVEPEVSCGPACGMPISLDPPLERA